MVKRKPPYFLIAMLVVFLGGGYLMNMQSRPPEPDEKPAAAGGPSRDATGAPGGKVNPDDVNKAMKTAVGSATAQTAGPKDLPGIPKGKLPPKSPSGVQGSDPLVAKAPEPYKPKPSESSTSTQWWKDGSNSKDGSKSGG